jgi:hypothetical protein
VSLASWLRDFQVTDAEVRTEIWRLGSRHLGEPLKGALGELEGSELPMRRIRLLRACVRKLQRR